MAWHVDRGRGYAAGDNRITLHPTEKDQFGLPIPMFFYDDHAKRYGLCATTRINRALGLSSVGAKTGKSNTTLSLNS